MKKRVLTLILSAILCLSTVLALTSCGSHTFKNEWEKDATHHWHACEDADCTEVSDKAEHTFDDGQETTCATDTANGVKTYTCTVCKQTKTEPTTFNGVNITQYGMAVDATTLENVTVKIKMTSENQTKTGTLMLNRDEYSLTGNLPEGNISGEDADAAAALRDCYLFFAVVDQTTGVNKLTHKDLIYNAAAKNYTTSDDFTLTVTDAENGTVTVYTSIVMTISGTQIQTVEAEFKTDHDGDITEGKIQLTLSDYNATEVIHSADQEDPEDPDNPGGTQNPGDYEENPDGGDGDDIVGDGDDPEGDDDDPYEDDPNEDDPYEDDPEA